MLQCTTHNLSGPIALTIVIDHGVSEDASQQCNRGPSHGHNLLANHRHEASRKSHEQSIEVTLQATFNAALSPGRGPMYDDDNDSISVPSVRVGKLASELDFLRGRAAQPGSRALKVPLCCSAECQRHMRK